MIANILRVHIKNEIVCNAGFDVLENVPFDIKQFSQKTKANEEISANNKVRAKKSGIIEAITKSLKVHIKNAEMYRVGCILLRNITTDSSKKPFLITSNEKFNKTDENKEEAGKAGAIETITKAIKTHKADEKICYEGCRALESIAMIRKVILHN